MSVRVEAAPPITTVIMDRPHRRNAVDRATADDLAVAFRNFDQDDSAHVAVLWGAGGTFCAGADLKAFAEGAGNRVEDQGDGPMGPTRMLLEKPTIAAISGHAVAGGLELALWCDLRVAEEDAVLGVFCRRFGVPLIDGGTIRLPRVVGMGRALDLILTGRIIDTDEALDWGLLTEVVDDGDHLDRALEIAAGLARFPQQTMLSDRRSAIEGSTLPLAESLELEARLGLESVRTGLEGAARFASGEGRGGEGAGV
jgi:enoyl-CoA hydratase